MAGTMDNNLRRAYIQEQLGVYLLRAVAAVAEVERPQDYGIDAIVTLLRPEDNRYLLARASFCVQLKSASVSNIVYKEDSLQWLKDLRTPMFIGSVDCDRMTLSLYTCHRALLALSNWNYKELVVHLRESPSPACTTENWLVEKTTNSNGTEKTAEVYLGPPVYELSPKKIDDVSVLTNFCDVLEPMISILHRNIQWQPIGYSERFKWDTGKPPKINGWGFATQVLNNHSSPPPLKSAQEYAAELYARGLPIFRSELDPYLKAWALYTLSFDSQTEQNKIEPLLDLLHEKGVLSNETWDSIKFISKDHFERCQQAGLSNVNSASAQSADDR